MTISKFTFALITLASTVALAQDKKVEPTKADAMKPPAPPAEVAALAKSMAGTWKCTGTMMDMADPTKTVPMNINMTSKLDLDKMWINTTLTGAFKATILTTYDASAKKWYRVMADNHGSSDVAWSTGPAGTKTVWDGDSRGPGMPANVKSRETDETVSPKETKMTGEGSMDGGKKYIKMWEATCKK